MTSVGEDIQISSCRAMTTPKTSMTTPLTRERATEVWMLRLTLSCRPAPKSRATTTLVPTDKPTNRLTIRLMSEVLEPTAANASLPTNCPTTTTSAALNSSCRMLEAIRGRANNRILLHRGPLHMSI